MARNSLYPSNIWLKTSLLALQCMNLDKIDIMNEASARRSNYWKNQTCESSNNWFYLCLSDIDCLYFTRSDLYIQRWYKFICKSFSFCLCKFICTSYLLSVIVFKILNRWCSRNLYLKGDRWSVPLISGRSLDSLSDLTNESYVCTDM
mgnify:CR=1 FL=1